MAEEDTMTTAASEDDPTIGEDLPSARGCTCRRIGSDNDDYESDNDQHVAAVPIQIHPDGRLEDKSVRCKKSLGRVKRWFFRNFDSSYIQEINEAEKDELSVDPVESEDILQLRPRRGRFTANRSPYIEFNPKQYLPIREVDLNNNDVVRGDSPNVYKSIVQQTEQSIKEAIAKATGSQGQVQVINDPESGSSSHFIQDHNPQERAIPMDEYLKENSPRLQETPIRVSLHQPPIYPRQYLAPPPPQQPLPYLKSNPVGLWYKPDDLMKHPIQLILQSIESKLSSCCESCKAEVLSDISERLKPRAKTIKLAEQTCEHPRNLILRKSVERLEGEGNSEEMPYSGEITRERTFGSKSSRYNPSPVQFKDTGTSELSSRKTTFYEPFQDSEEIIRPKMVSKNNRDYPRKQNGSRTNHSSSKHFIRESNEESSEQLKDYSKMVSNLKNLEKLYSKLAKLNKSQEESEENEASTTTTKPISRNSKRSRSSRNKGEDRRRKSKTYKSKSGNRDSV
ncbi:unnamed protein product [Hermetia illucens]|uniref:Uncharacterized protein n=1 Tax=Hermetia illucens TaxID=343691 RepID=A0A7R8Z118_HERIL|nr:unnamed protein product [Hermetia illucens]